jgi:hypothetical protein
MNEHKLFTIIGSCMAVAALALAAVLATPILG